jgi:murein DD-endopeptidase MepM/ murein hydrolase activator NlpD
VFQWFLNLGKLLLGFFAKSSVGMQSQEISPPITSEPIPTTEPVPTVNPPVPTVNKPAPVVSKAPMWHAVKGGDSHWWIGHYPITQPYGCTSLAEEGHNPYHPECAYFHEGVDFALPCGTEVFSGAHAQVIYIDPPGYGPPGNSAAICLREASRDFWLYHMQRYVVKVGQAVDKGELIGYSDNRGYSTGCHIHFEVRPVGKPYRHSINPMQYL